MYIYIYIYIYREREREGGDFINNCYTIFMIIVKYFIIFVFEKKKCQT